jgi:hypothetical protein
LKLFDLPNPARAVCVTVGIHPVPAPLILFTWETHMLSPHEFATLMLVKDTSDPAGLDRAELDALLEHQLVALEKLASGGEHFSITFEALVEDAARNAPAGSEATIAAWKSAITTTSTLVETLQKTGQQAVQLAESNFEAAKAAASTAARRTAGQPSDGAKR